MSSIHSRARELTLAPIAGKSVKEFVDMLKLVQENREKEDGHVPGVWRVPGTGHQVRILAWESHGQRSLAGLPSYRKEFKTEPQKGKSRFI